MTGQFHRRRGSEMLGSSRTQHAAMLGVGQKALSEADDAPNVKAAVIDLILQANRPEPIDLPENKVELRRLLKEAQYFKLPELVSLCREKLRGPIRTHGDREPIFDVPGLENHAVLGRKRGTDGEGLT